MISGRWLSALEALVSGDIPQVPVPLTGKVKRFSDGHGEITPTCKKSRRGVRCGTPLLKSQAQNGIKPLPYEQF
jgi:hypothetical protein